MPCKKIEKKINRMLNNRLGLNWAIAIAILMKMVRKSNSWTIFLSLMTKLDQWMQTGKQIS